MPNEKELATSTLELLKRVDIKGGEVPAFVAINNWLQDKAKDVPEFHDPSNKE